MELTPKTRLQIYKNLIISVEKTRQSHINNIFGLPPHSIKFDDIDYKFCDEINKSTEEITSAKRQKLNERVDKNMSTPITYHLPSKSHLKIPIPNISNKSPRTLPLPHLDKLPQTLPLPQPIKTFRIVPLPQPNKSPRTLPLSQPTKLTQTSSNLNKQIPISKLRLEIITP